MGGKELVGLAEGRQAVVSYENTLLMINKIRHTPSYHQLVSNKAVPIATLSPLVGMDKEVSPSDGPRAFHMLLKSLQNYFANQMFAQCSSKSRGDTEVLQQMDRLLRTCNEIFMEYGAVPLDKSLRACSGRENDGAMDIDTDLPPVMGRHQDAPVAQDSSGGEGQKKQKVLKKEGAKESIEVTEARKEDALKNKLHKKQKLSSTTASTASRHMKIVPGSRKNRSLEEVELTENALVLQALSGEVWDKQDPREEGNEPAEGLVVDSPAKPAVQVSVSPKPKKQQKPKAKCVTFAESNHEENKSKEADPATEVKAKRARPASHAGKKKAEKEEKQSSVPRYTGELVNLNKKSQQLLALVLQKAFPEDPSIAKQDETEFKSVGVQSIVVKSVGQLQGAVAQGDKGSHTVLGGLSKGIELLSLARLPDVNALVELVCGDTLFGEARHTFEAVLAVTVKSFQSTREGRPEFPLSITMNNEPYLNKDWTKTPYERKKYERIEDYVPAGGKEDEALITQKLKSLKTGGCDGTECAKGCLDVDDFFGGSIETVHPCLKRNTECDQTCKCDPASCPNRDVHKGSRISFDKDLEERDVWGFDCYTRRNIEDALVECGVFGEGVPVHSVPDVPARNVVGDAVLASVSEFVDTVLMPGINANTSGRAWDIRSTLEAVIKENEGDGKIATACKAIRDRVDESGLNYFRIHPKGCGVICVRPEGIRKATFVSNYLGEVYLSSRWFQLQDCIKKFNPKQALNDFYNIVLERPCDDPGGYDVLFVDAAYKGAVASRFSHSCVPNCEANVISSNGKLSIAIYTARDIAYGEELSFDYSCVTESLMEYREAICLCGMGKCRGSFLSLADGKAYQQIMQTHHNFLHKNAILLKSCTEDLTDSDYRRLESFNFKSSLLCAPGQLSKHPLSADTESQLPKWLLKWVSYTLQFIEEEEKLLPASLVEHFPHIYNMEQAVLESKGVRAQRVQNLAITIDKVKFILFQPGQTHVPPLRRLSEAEQIEYLWTGEQSILRRLLSLTQRPMKGLETLNAKFPNPDMMETVEKIRSFESQQAPTTVASARQKLEEISRYLKSLDVQTGRSDFIAMVDLVRMYAFTENLFTLHKYKSVVSSDIIRKKHIQYMQNSKSTEKRISEMQSEDLIPSTGKKFCQTFLWGQLMYWFKQTIYDPNASVSADRRGTVSLPDVESAKGNYKQKQHDQLKVWLSERPHQLWKTGTNWSFKNSAKVYGSPWLDAALEKPFGLIQKEDCNLDDVFDLRVSVNEFKNSQD
mmetsp:Transcript_11397/g.31701  ORF Transcript_11397/g.31701 Transcript_11397/m.31701 type:complete len:1269 (-) Transcript_11397:54-3860(-)